MKKILKTSRRAHAACSLTILALAFIALIAGITPARAAWQLVWNDEFAQADGSPPDSTKWGYDLGGGGWGNSEWEYYTSRTNNARIEGGQLIIEAKQESYAGSNYTSARLLTKGKFSWTYGKIEARIKIPRGQGIWPAFWMLGTNINPVGWPACGEIDIMENIGREPTTVHGTIHGPGYSGGNSIGAAGLTTNGAAFADDFHLFAVEWTTNQIKWFVDGRQYFSATPASLPSGTTWVFTQPQFIILNVAVGGLWPGYPDATTTFPQRMAVDYVRVYRYLLSPPDAPTGLKASPGSAKAFLSWSASTSDAAGYTIKRATSSGGPYTTIGSSTNNEFTDAPLANCAAYFYVVSATNAAGESANSPESTAALGSFAVAVNSGGSAAGQFLADTFFSGGTQAAPVNFPINTSFVTAPAPQAAYQSERYGNFSYTFTGLTPGLTYQVRLHFAEFYWTAAGKRKFNVSINGTHALTNFDIVAVAGAANRANIQEFAATATGGQIVIQYTTVLDNAKSSGIEILLPQPAAPAGLVANPSGPQVNLSWNPVTGATYSVKRAAVAVGPYITLSTGLTATDWTDAAPAYGGPSWYVVSANLGGCESPDSAPASVTVEPPRVNLLAAPGAIILGWPAGTLQSATNLGGPWQDLTNASSPRTNQTVLPQEFYRVRWP